MRFHALLIGAAVLLMAADAKDDEKKDLERFQGAWVFVSVEIGGQPVDIKLFNGASLTLDGTKFTEKEGDRVTHGAYQIDVTKNRKPWTSLSTTARGRGKRFRAFTSWRAIRTRPASTYRARNGQPNSSRRKGRRSSWKC
jgi:uncharacterized protein (TIGR03067 family)